MVGYLNLCILGYIPWVIVDVLIKYINIKVAVLISMLIIAPSICSAIKERDFIGLTFVTGFIAYVIHLVYKVAPLSWYSTSITLIVGMVALISIIVEKPFTITYAKIKVSPDKWSNPIFIKINIIISSVWTSIFLGEYISQLIHFPYYNVFNVVLIIGGFIFSDKFPSYYKKRTGI